MHREASEDQVVQGLQRGCPLGVVHCLDTLQFLRKLSWERKPLHPVEPPKKVHAADSKRIRLLRDGNIPTDMRAPIIMASEIGWSFSDHSGLLMRPSELHYGAAPGRAEQSFDSGAASDSVHCSAALQHAAAARDCFVAGSPRSHRARRRQSSPPLLA